VTILPALLAASGWTRAPNFSAASFEWIEVFYTRSVGTRPLAI